MSPSSQYGNIDRHGAVFSGAKGQRLLSELIVGATGRSAVDSAEGYLAGIGDIAIAAHLQAHRAVRFANVGCGRRKGIFLRLLRAQPR